MEHSIKITAHTIEAIQDAAKAAGASGYQYYQIGDGYLGIIKVGQISQRYHVRNHPDVHIIPHHSSTANVDHHAKKLGLENIKTARDFHAAVFSQLNLDELDPDL